MKYIAGAIAMIVLGLGLLILMNREGAPAPIPKESEEPHAEVISRVYVSETGEAAFEYPADYVVIPVPEFGDDIVEQVVFFEEDVYEEFENSDGPREGPTAITFDAYRNSELLSVEMWVRTNNRSNFNLGPETLEQMTVAGLPAVSYTWSGLYEGRSVAVAREENVYLFSVTRLTPNDRNLAVFEDILDSVRFVGAE